MKKKKKKKKKKHTHAHDDRFSRPELSQASLAARTRAREALEAESTRSSHPTDRSLDERSSTNSLLFARRVASLRRHVQLRAARPGGRGEADVRADRWEPIAARAHQRPRVSAKAGAQLQRVDQLCLSESSIIYTEAHTRLEPLLRHRKHARGRRQSPRLPGHKLRDHARPVPARPQRHGPRSRRGQARPEAAPAQAERSTMGLCRLRVAHAHTRPHKLQRLL